MAKNDSTLLQNESGATVSLGVAIGNKLCSKRHTTVKVPVGGRGLGARGCMEQGVTRLSTPWGARHRLAALCDVSITYAPCGLPQNAKG